jgi:hypothetical protein
MLIIYSFAGKFVVLNKLTWLRETKLFQEEEKIERNFWEKELSSILNLSKTKSLKSMFSSYSSLSQPANVPDLKA